MTCFYKVILQDIKAAIEGTQTNEVRGHFTKNRPMAEMAQIYAMVCCALSTEQTTVDQPKIDWRLVE